MKKKKLILVEGAIACLPCEIYKVADECGYQVKLVQNFEKFRKRGEVPFSQVSAVFLGPRPHNIRGGDSRILQHLDGIELGGVKFFVCSTLTLTKRIKITKASFIKAFAQFLNSER